MEIQPMTVGHRSTVVKVVIMKSSLSNSVRISQIIEGIIPLPCFFLAKYEMWHADSLSEVDERFQDQAAVPEPGADNSRSLEVWVVPELSVSFVLVAMCIYHHL